MPIVGLTPLTDWQFTYNGITMGGDPTNYDITGVKGLDDLPAMRSSDIPRPQDHGEFAGTDYAAGRLVEVTGTVFGVADSDFRTNVDALNGATVPQPVELPLVFQLPGAGNRQINCRPRRRALPQDMSYKFRDAAFTIQFYATDPRIYDATVQSATLGVPTVSGGLTWPLSWPLSWGSASGASQFLNNAGTFPTRPVVVLNGPLDTPKIERVTSPGAYLLFNIALLAGDVLTVDFNARTVLLGGTASRYFTLMPGSTWFDLSPGSTEVRLSANAGTGNAVVTWRSAWT